MGWTVLVRTVIQIISNVVNHRTHLPALSISSHKKYILTAAWLLVTCDRFAIYALVGESAREKKGKKSCCTARFKF